MTSISSAEDLIALIQSANANDPHAVKIINNIMEARFSDKLLKFLKSTSSETYSILFLGILFEGGIGIPKDFQKAKILYEKAMEGGSGLAIYNLACMYNEGIGVTVDYQKAKFLYEKAIEHGCGMASHDLAHMYQYGLGIPVDIRKAKFLRVKAKSFYERAIGHGSKIAVDHLTKLYRDDETLRSDTLCNHRILF